MSHVKEASASVFCKVHGEQESCCMVCSDLNIQLMEAKLERAVEALRVYARIDLDPHYTYCRCDEGRKARATLLVIEK